MEVCRENAIDGFEWRIEYWPEIQDAGIVHKNCNVGSLGRQRVDEVEVGDVYLKRHDPTWVERIGRIETFEPARARIDLSSSRP